MDVVLICVKAWQVTEAAEAIQPMLGRDTFVVPLCNGVDAAQQLSTALGSERVLAGLCGIFSRITSPGHIQHTGANPFIGFGELDNCPTERAHSLLAVLQNAGIDSEIPSDITQALWQKYILVTPFSGIGALTRVPIGVYRSHKEIMQMFESAVQECFSVAIAQGINLANDSVMRTMASLSMIPPDTTSTMQRDMLNGRPSELEAFNGNIVRLGKSLNIQTPVNSFIYNSLLPQEYLAREKIKTTAIKK